MSQAKINSDDKYVLVKNKHVKNNELDDSSFRIYTYLKTHNLAEYTPNYEMVMKDTGKSRSTVYRAFRELKKHNLIVISRITHGYMRIKLIG